MISSADKHEHSGAVATAEIGPEPERCEIHNAILGPGRYCPRCFDTEMRRAIAIRHRTGR
jgi:hypothetical protein